MSEQGRYFLGYRDAEQVRLQQQAEQLGGESAQLFDEIGVSEGDRVLEIGCGPRGCLDLLSARVGPSGKVVGIEVGEDAAATANAFLTDQGIANVEVLCGDARALALPQASFDLVTSRLVLVNIPEPESVVSTAVALARPGGAVAFHEVDWVAVMCDPPSQAWTSLVNVLNIFSEKNGNDLFIGRKLPRMLREAGLVDIRVRPIFHAHPLGDPRRTLLLTFADNLRERLLSQKLIGEEDLDAMKDAVGHHLDDPGTMVFIGPYIQAWGRKPG